MPPAHSQKLRKGRDQGQRPPEGCAACPLGRTFPSVVFPASSPPRTRSYESFSQEIRKAIGLAGDHTMEQELGARHCPAGITLEPSENNIGVSTSSEFVFLSFFFFSSTERASITEVRRGGGGFPGREARGSSSRPHPPHPAPAQSPQSGPQGTGAARS